MDRRKTPSKITVKEVDVAREDSGVTRGIAMEVMEVVREGGEFAE